MEELLRKNNYPVKLILKWKFEMINCINNGIQDNSIGNISMQDSSDDTILIVEDEEEPVYHVGITYVQGMSESVQRQLAYRNKKVMVAHLFEKNIQHGKREDPEIERSRRGVQDQLCRRKW